MTLPDTFSRRKRATQNKYDPLVYDILPNPLRNQVIQIFDEVIDLASQDRSRIYTQLNKFMRKEIGTTMLSQEPYPPSEFYRWFCHEQLSDFHLDAVEAICRLILELEARHRRSSRYEILQKIEELNARFLEASVGYQFEAGRLLQIDSKFEHKEVVVPALGFLAAKKYEAAEHEFLDAFDAFREGDYETTLVEACKSLESVIKVIGSEKGWGLDPNWPLKKLVGAVFDNDLIPSYMQTEFAGLKTILESGVGTVRNKSAGHGAGEKKREVPRHIAAFQLHQTAAAILLLIGAADA